MKCKLTHLATCHNIDCFFSVSKGPVINFQVLIHYSARFREATMFGNTNQQTNTQLKIHEISKRLKGYHQDTKNGTLKVINKKNIQNK